MTPACPPSLPPSRLSRRRCLTWLAGLGPLTVAAQAPADGPRGATSATPGAPAPRACVVPAKPGGGYELTCQLARQALAPQGLDLPLAYQPGGIGALAYHQVVRGGRGAGRELIAFSSGTLLNLAQGRFGRHEPDKLRWVATLALDHGAVAVHRDASWPDLTAMLGELAVRPGAMSLAAGGTIGSQDWMKAALLARAAGVSHKAMRVVAFEGGGDAVQALVGRHVQVLCGDAAELSRQLAQGAPVRLLAMLSPTRLGGVFAGVRTAREQGVDLVWPILRGLYTGAGTPAAVAAEWGRQLLEGLQSASVAAALSQLALQPHGLVGTELERAVDEALQRYRVLAGEFGLIQPGR